MEQTILSKTERKVEKSRFRKKKFDQIKKNKMLYVMLIPGVLYFIIFKYIPMGGLIIAFQDYQPFLGILGSPMVGLKHFQRMIADPIFFDLIRNTLTIFGLNVVFAFPFPIILALMLNELKSEKFKKAIQTIIYLPHFMSWVIVVSIFYMLLTTEGGVVNNLLESIGDRKSVV